MNRKCHYILVHIKEQSQFFNINDFLNLGTLNSFKLPVFLKFSLPCSHQGDLVNKELPYFYLFIYIINRFKFFKRVN